MRDMKIKSGQEKADPIYRIVQKQLIFLFQQIPNFS